MAYPDVDILSLEAQKLGLLTNATHSAVEILDWATEQAYLPRAPKTAALRHLSRAAYALETNQVTHCQIALTLLCEHATMHLSDKEDVQPSIAKFSRQLRQIDFWLKEMNKITPEETPAVKSTQHGSFFKHAQVREQQTSGTMHRMAS